MSWLIAHRLDALLVIVVGIQATVLAYLHRPRMKAVVLALPIPFTLLSLIVNRPIDATNILGLVILMVSSLAVMFLHYRLKAPIVVAAAAGLLGHCLVGYLLFPIVPTTGVAFWLAAAGAAAIGGALHATMPHRKEPGHRSPLPVWVKLPAVTAVILFLVSLKGVLGGFVTSAPIVTVIAWYEARNSLWTVCRKIPVLLLSMAPMMGCIRLVQQPLGLGGAIALGWIAYLCVFVPVTLLMWRRDDLSAASAPAPQAQRD